MVIKDQVSNETAARAYSQQGHGNQQADPKAGYISATSRRRAIELLRTAAGTYIALHAAKPAASSKMCFNFLSDTLGEGSLDEALSKSSATIGPGSDLTIG